MSNITRKLRRDRMAIKTMPMGKNRISGRKGEASARIIPADMMGGDLPRTKFAFGRDFELVYHFTKGWRFRRP